MRKLFRLMIGCFFALAVGGALAESYEVGQIWSYRTRPQEPNSALMILRIDSSTDLGEVIFIRLYNLNFRSTNGTILVPVLSPLPFTRAALDRSVLKLTRKTDMVEQSELAYTKWKQAHLEGKKVALYKRPVAQVLPDLEAVIVKKHGDSGAATTQSR
jgi:hypothetical protein